MAAVGAALVAVTAGCGDDRGGSPDATPSGNGRPLAVFAQSPLGSAIRFDLPAGWAPGPASRTTAAFTSADHRQSVAVVLATAPLTRAGSAEAVLDVIAGEVGKLPQDTYGGACVVALESAGGRVTFEAENPCSAPHRKSLADPARDAPGPSTPADARHRLAMTWIAAPSGNGWAVLYDAPADIFDATIQARVAGDIRLQQSNAIPSYRTRVPGAAAAAAFDSSPASPTGLANVRPATLAPGVDVSDACRLVARDDLATVPDVPPAVSLNGRASSLGAKSVCEVHYGKAAEIATLAVSVFDQPLPAVVDTVAKNDGLNRRIERSVSDGADVVTALASGPADPDFGAEAYLSAGPARTVRLTFTGPGDELSLWDLQVVSAEARAIVRRLASGTLAPSVASPAGPRPGVHLDGMQTGRSTVNQTNVCDLLDPSAAKLVGGTPLELGKYYPHSCRSEGKTFTLDVALWDGSLADGAATGNSGVPHGAGVSTRLVNGITVVADDGGGGPMTHAAVAVSPGTWADVLVTYPKGRAREALGIRDRLIQQVTAHSRS